MAMTLDDFRTAVQKALGNRGYDNDLVDQWINFGYMDLCGAVQFEILFTETEESTVAAQNYIDVPDNTLVVFLVKDLDNDLLLGEISKSEYYRRKVEAGDPKRYCWMGQKILLTPVPDSILDLLIITEQSPAVLSNNDDVSILPDMWDIAILDLAVHYGLFNTGQEARSAAWLSRAVSYIQSRLTEQDLKPKNGLDAMQDKLAALQSQGA